MVYVIVLVLLVGTVWLVAGPLLRPRPDAAHGAGGVGGAGGTGGAGGGLSATDVDRVERRIDLEAARDAKYREIRDAELDHQTGKLSETDFNAIRSTLRAEALELLRELDRLDELDELDDLDDLDDLDEAQ